MPNYNSAPRAARQPQQMSSTFFHNFIKKLVDSVLVRLINIVLGIYAKNGGIKQLSRVLSKQQLETNVSKLEV